MSKSVKTRDKTLQVNLFDEGMVEIESPIYKKIGIEVKRVDPTADVAVPKSALYQINVYIPEEKDKVHPFEYDTAWVMSDGTILHRNERRSKGI